MANVEGRSRPKWSADEVTKYYREVHVRALRDSRDSLAPVINPGWSDWTNRAIDYAHRQGMARALRYLSKQFADWSGLHVLDLGCGRGRWSRMYSARGAEVVGLDISVDALRALAAELRTGHFVCGDVSMPPLADNSFDLVNSVTVIQHLPYDRQGPALHSVARMLRPGGYFVMLENIDDFRSQFVYPRAADDWMALASQYRLSAEWRSGSNFDIPHRVLSRVNRLFTYGANGRAAERWQRLGRTQSTLEKGTRTIAALVTFPTEWACQRIPLASATHVVAVLRKC